MKIRTRPKMGNKKKYLITFISRTLIIVLGVLILFFIESKAQNYFPFICSNEKPFSEKDFKKWVDIDVNYIITKAEKKAFLSLQNDEDRNTFIGNFWLRRDPNPNTEVNEFRDEYCKRLIETIQFDAGMPGWRTDRGLIYILYGKPDSVERGRTDFEKFKNVLFEKWKYKYLEGFCPSVEFTFFDPTETNGFRLSEGKHDDLLKLNENGLTTNFDSCRKGSFNV